MPYNDPAKLKLWTEKNKELIAEKWHRRKYKATKEQWEHYKKVSHCECCGIELASKTGRHLPFNCKVQDHCHKTGLIRGVLCSACNTAEGYLKSVERAEKMLEYMKKWQY